MYVMYGKAMITLEEMRRDVERYRLMAQELSDTAQLLDIECTANVDDWKKWDILHRQRCISKSVSDQQRILVLTLENNIFQLEELERLHDQRRQASNQEGLPLDQDRPNAALE